MKLYIAHNWAARDDLRKYTIPELITLGHQVNARWLIEPDHEKGGMVGEAQKDWQDILSCDALLFCTDQFGDTPGAGKYVELGIALEAGKKIFLWGEAKRCVFYHLPGLIWIKSLEEIK